MGPLLSPLPATVPSSKSPFTRISILSTLFMIAILVHYLTFCVILSIVEYFKQPSLPKPPHGIFWKSPHLCIYIIYWKFYQSFNGKFELDFFHAFESIYLKALIFRKGSVYSRYMLFFVCVCRGFLWDWAGLGNAWTYPILLIVYKHFWSLLDLIVSG